MVFVNGARAGNSLLPHGNARNTSDAPRQAMFLTYVPAVGAAARLKENDLEMARERRIAAWQGSLGGAEGAPGDPRENNAGAEPAELTPLGERLLGSRPW